MREPGDQKPILSVRFFVTAEGREPVREWLCGLDREDRRSVGFDIKTAQFGWPIGMPLIRKLEPGLWEIRPHIANGIAKVLFTGEGIDMGKQNIGSDFDDFLRDEGILEEAEAIATKRAIAYQIAQEMRRANISQSELARRMKTSRSSVERLLDPTNPSVTLVTLQRAANAVGKRLKVQLTP